MPQLGEILVRNNTITKQDLDRAIAKQKQTGGLLGIILIEFGVLSSEDLGKALRNQDAKHRQETKS